MIKEIFYDAVMYMIIGFLGLLGMIPVINYLNSIQQESLEQEVIDNQEYYESIQPKGA